MRIATMTLLALTMVSAMLTTRAVGGDLANVTRALTEVPSPPQGETRWIAKSMRMNGLPMTLKSFRSRLDPQAVCQHYRAAAGRGETVETSFSRRGEWTLLSIKSHRDLVTVEARSTLAGSEGTITVSPVLETAHTVIATAFPAPATTSIVNLQEYDDDGIEAEHISMTSLRSVAVEASAFVHKLRGNGWQIVREQPTRAASAGRLIEAQKGAQHALLTLMQNRAQQGTAIVVVWRKS